MDYIEEIVASISGILIILLPFVARAILAKWKEGRARNIAVGTRSTGASQYGITQSGRQLPRKTMTGSPEGEKASNRPIYSRDVKPLSKIRGKEIAPNGSISRENAQQQRELVFERPSAGMLRYDDQYLVKLKALEESRNAPDYYMRTNGTEEADYARARADNPDEKSLSPAFGLASDGYQLGGTVLQVRQVRRDVSAGRVARRSTGWERINLLPPLKRAVIMSEILGPPLGLSECRSQRSPANGN